MGLFVICSSQVDCAFDCALKFDYLLCIHLFYCMSYQVEVNAETGQTILSGMGELHLDIVNSRIRKEYGIETNLGPLQIAYRETITQHAEASEVSAKSFAGHVNWRH